FHILRNLNGEFGTCTSQRMSEGDSTSVYIHYFSIEIQFTDHSERLTCKSLIQFNQIDLRKFHTSLFQCLGYSFNRPNPHDARMHSCAGATYQTRDGFQSQL